MRSGTTLLLSMLPAAAALSPSAAAYVPSVLLPENTPVRPAASTLGSRDGYIHWGQEMYDQAGMLRELVKWDYELRNAEQLGTVVDRALSIAGTEPRGPVYLF
jgi:acetolactate synthase I/II/III large subunit